MKVFCVFNLMTESTAYSHNCEFVLSKYIVNFFYKCFGFSKKIQCRSVFDFNNQINSCPLSPLDMVVLLIEGEHLRRGKLTNIS